MSEKRKGAAITHPGLTADIPKKESTLFDAIKPGIVTGMGGDDPAGIATYALSGIRFAYSQLWLLVIATPMLIAVQSMVARITIVTRRGLSTNFREHFSQRWALFAVVLLIIANILTIGADIAAMAESMTLLIPGTLLIHWVVPISFITWYIVLFFNYKEISRYLLWLVLVFGAFIISAFLSNANWQEVFQATVRPSFSLNKEYFLAALALLGTTISPYMLYWESQETIEEKTPKRFASLQAVVQTPGFVLSNFVSFMIIVCTGTLLHGQASGDITATQVAAALGPVAGVYASKIFAIGILGAGFLAVPVLAASAACALSNALGWREGLSLKPTQAKGFYEVISIAMLVGVQIAISGFDPIKALFYSQVASGVLMPPLLLMVIILANKKSVMGKYTNGWFDNIFGILTLCIFLAACIGFFASL